MRLFWERVLRFGCYKPGGRSLSPSTAQALMAKDKDSVCVVKSKDGNRTLYYRRRGIVEKIESEEKKEKAEQRLARQEKALEKTKAGTKKAGVLQGRVERQRERLKQAIERLRQDTERYTRAKKLLEGGGILEDVLDVKKEKGKVSAESSDNNTLLKEVERAYTKVEKKKGTGFGTTMTFPELYEEMSKTVSDLTIPRFHELLLELSTRGIVDLLSINDWGEAKNPEFIMKGFGYAKPYYIWWRSRPISKQRK